MTNEEWIGKLKTLNQSKYWSLAEEDLLAEAWTNGGEERQDTIDALKRENEQLRNQCKAIENAWKQSILGGDEI